MTPRSAVADARDLTLRIALSGGIPVQGYLAPPGNRDNTAMLGAALSASLDYVLADPFALELELTTGFLADRVGDAPPQVGDGGIRDANGRMIFSAAVGGRLRFLSNRQLSIAAHTGVYGFDGIQFGGDVAIGYELDISSRVRLGVFTRGQMTARGQGAFAGEDHFDAAVFVGSWVALHRAPRIARVEAPPPVEVWPVLPVIDPWGAEYCSRPLGPDGVCPPPDRDGDRTIDVRDGCPEVPGPIPNGGCPEPDSDGDTVPDHRDDCPDVPGPVPFIGCPEAQPVTVSEGVAAIVLYA